MVCSAQMQWVEKAMAFLSPEKFNVTNTFPSRAYCHANKSKATCLFLALSLVGKNTEGA